MDEEKPTVSVYHVIPSNDAVTRLLNRERGFPVPPHPAAQASSTKRCGSCGGAGRYNVHTEEKKDGKTVITVVSRPCGTCGGSGRVPA
ncbi:hypothetical protein FHS43_000585 [Streptosporangium becharense]|uniref:Uncharacterized protein n=1 Tax=Streptosporangium becharense TaxID=1816182 RepID=A0A7W9IN33_9ACTN|nr:hypothetical protein [Streptosporangium becharense]MBB2909339.1 hypothetical protein [Streptosporangium becharense]MBB5823758.1 hypothetical protein [Streptosporangium becharense]